MKFIKSTMGALILLYFSHGVLSAQKRDTILVQTDNVTTLSDSAIIARMQTYMVEWGRDLVEIIKEIESVEDVKASEPALKEAMDDLSRKLIDLTAQVDYRVLMNEVTSLFNPLVESDLLSAMSFSELEKEFDALERKMKREHPEAEKALKKKMDEYGEETVEYAMYYLSSSQMKRYETEYGIPGQKKPILEEYRTSAAEISEKVIPIIHEIRSLEDLDSAEPAIRENMEELTSAFALLIQRFQEMDSKAQNWFGGRMAILGDGKAARSINEIDYAMVMLQKRSPEAAARLEEIGNEYSLRHEELIDQLREDKEGKRRERADDKVDSSDE